MAKNSYFGKLSIVVFLTVLIWVWADLALDERLALSNVARLSVAKSSDPTLWLSFEGADASLQDSVTLDNIELKGPASQVADVVRMRNRGELDVALFLVPEQEGFTETGTRTLDVLNFLRQSDTIRQLGLTVEDCEPKTLTVHIRQLVEKSLPVECVDENGIPLKAEAEPSAVSVFVPPDEILVAKVRLSTADMSVARTTAIQKTPYVELAPGQRRNATTKVTVTLPAADELKDYQVSGTYGFCFSPNLQGKCEVELQNETELISAILKIKATPAAQQAYEQQPFKIFLHILDEDLQAPDFITRRVEFNFPDEYVGLGQIRADEPAPEARFRLVPIPAPADETPGS